MLFRSVETVVLSDTAAGTHWLIALDDAGTMIHVYRSTGESQGDPQMILPLSTPLILVDSPQSFLTIDLMNGNPLPSGGIQFMNGSAHALSILGSDGDDLVALTAAEVMIDGRAIVHGGLEQLTIDGRAGEDTLEVLGGEHVMGASIDVEKLVLRNAGTLVQLTAPRALAAIAIEDGAALDVGAHDLLVATAGTSMADIRAMVAAGRSGGTWTGAGIRSSAAAADSRTSLATVLDSSGNVRVKHTWLGDANGDGQVNGTDYFLTDLGFLSAGLGWSAGDYNYDDGVDGDDYFLIDSAFLQQAAILAPAGAAVVEIGRAHV